MTPQYQFNLGQGDPLLTSRVTSPEQFYDNISQEIERLDEKIIHSAINFWFEDEDAGSGKVWNYFKNI